MPPVQTARATLVGVRVGGAGPVAVDARLVLGGSAATMPASQGLALEPLAHLDNALWAPQDCPLCAADTPLHGLIS